MMKKIVKRTLSLVMAVAVIVGTLVMPVAAEETATVIYENDFESYIGGIPASTAACTVTKNSGAWSAAMAVTTYEGFGKGLMVDEAQLNGKSSVQPVFTPTVKPTTGKVCISFDMANDISDETAVTGSASHSGVLMGTNQYLLGMFEDGAGNASFASPFKGFANNSWEKSVSYEPGDGIHNVQIVLDIDTKYYAAYIDGVLLNSFTAIAAIDFSKITFILNPYIIDYFDNLRIAYMTEDSFKAEYKKYEDNELTFSFSEAVPVTADVSSLKIVNTITGETMEIESAEMKNTKELSVRTVSALEEGEEYQLELPEGFKNIGENTLMEMVLFTIPASGAYFSKIRLVDKDGAEHLLSDKTSVVSNIIRLYMSEEISDVSGITVRDSSGEEIGYTPAISGSVAELVLENYLMGNETYTLTVPDSVIGSGKEYSFTTGAGTIAVLTFEFTKNGTAVDISDISQGDEITLTAEIVKTTKEKKNLYLSYSKWQERLMNGFDFIDMTLEESDTYKKETIEIEINSSDDLGKLKLKGFLREGLNAKNPLVNNIEL